MQNRYIMFLFHEGHRSLYMARPLRGRRAMDTVHLFFFQAEDGIRDVAVTGVQTCALPICPERRRSRQRFILERKVSSAVASALWARFTWSKALFGLLIVNVAWTGSLFICPFRSEERRVGKEGRSRWSPYH